MTRMSLESKSARTWVYIFDGGGDGAVDSVSRETEKTNHTPIRKEAVVLFSTALAIQLVFPRLRKRNVLMTHHFFIGIGHSIEESNIIISFLLISSPMTRE